MRTECCNQPPIKGTEHELAGSLWGRCSQCKEIALLEKETS